MAKYPRKCPEPKQSEAFRADGWQNIMTGVGAASFDKRNGINGRMVSKRMGEFEAEEIWRGDAIAARAIETIPLVMVRNGVNVAITDPAPADRDNQEKQSASVIPIANVRTDGRRRRSVRRDAVDPANAKKELTQKLGDLDVVAKFIGAMQTARALGGAALWMGVEDQGKSWDDMRRLEKPVNRDLVANIRHLTLLRPHECWPIRFYTDDPQDPKFGTPSHFYIARDTMGGTGSVPIVVHESRLLRFFGTVTSTRQMAMNNSWGEPILLRFIESVADMHGGFQGAGLLLSDFAQAVHAIEGLAELVAAGEDATIIRRAEMIARGRSIARTVLIDSKETYERKATPMSGLPEALDRLCLKAAAEIDMPVTMMMGQAPAGLNATGDSDIRAFYDSAANNRELKLRPMLEDFIRLIFLSSEGPTAGVEPAGWRLNFHPLWQLTGKEIAERNYAQAQADGVYVSNAILTPEEVADSRFSGDEWSAETHLDEEIREKMADAHAGLIDEAVAEGAVPNPSPIDASATGERKAAAEEAAARLNQKPGEAPAKKSA